MKNLLISSISFVVMLGFIAATCVFLVAMLSQWPRDAAMWAYMGAAGSAIAALVCAIICALTYQSRHEREYTEVIQEEIASI